MTDKEIENFVNWLQSCTAKKFYSADAEDLIFEFKNHALSQHDVMGSNSQPNIKAKVVNIETNYGDINL